MESFKKELAESIKTINSLFDFRGGENNDIPINDKSIEDMLEIVATCNKKKIQQPEIHPWMGGDGVQAEWNVISNGSSRDWYFEISSSSSGIRFFILKSDNNTKDVEIAVTDIYQAIRLLKFFLDSIVNL